MVAEAVRPAAETDAVFPRLRIGCAMKLPEAVAASIAEHAVAKPRISRYFLCLAPRAPTLGGIASGALLINESDTRTPVFSFPLKQFHTE